MSYLNNKPLLRCADFICEHKNADDMYYCRNYKDCVSYNKQSCLRSTEEITSDFVVSNSLKCITSKEVITREDFAVYLTNLNLTNIAVEVGTHRGEYANMFLSRWKGKSFYAVDIWDKFFGDPLGDSEYRNDDYQETINVLDKYKTTTNINILKMTSVDGSKIVPNDIDFVYIDANHLYSYVKQDIETWYPKIKSGGIIGGHDYVKKNIYGSLGIKIAVDEFAIKNNKDVYYIPNNSSWYIIK